MARLAFKDPDNAAQLTLNYANQLDTGVTVIGSSWTVPTGLTNDLESFTSSTTSITVSGGTDGVTYELINTVTRSAGDNLDAAVYLAVAEEVLTEPRSLPVSLGELKHYLRVTTDDDDTQLKGLLAAAVAYVEGVTDRTLVDKTYTVKCRRFPYTGFQLDAAPVRSLARIRYYDGDNAIQTLDPATYQVYEDDSGETQVQLAVGQSWPTIAVRDDAIQLLVVAGYGVAAEDVPELAKLAIKMVARDWYDNPGGYLTGTISANRAIDAILWNLKTGLYVDV